MSKRQKHGSIAPTHATASGGDRRKRGAHIWVVPAGTVPRREEGCKQPAPATSFRCRGAGEGTTDRTAGRTRFGAPFSAHTGLGIESSQVLLLSCCLPHMLMAQLDLGLSVVRVPVPGQLSWARQFLPAEPPPPRASARSCSRIARHSPGGGGCPRCGGGGGDWHLAPSPFGTQGDHPHCTRHATPLVD